MDIDEDEKLCYYLSVKEKLILKTKGERFQGERGKRRTLSGKGSNSLQSAAYAENK